MLQSSLLNVSGIPVRVNENALGGGEAIVLRGESVCYLDENGQKAEKRIGIHKGVPMQTLIHIFFCKMKSPAHTHQYNSIIFIVYRKICLNYKRNIEVCQYFVSSKAN